MFEIVLLERYQMSLFLTSQLLWISILIVKNALEIQKLAQNVNSKVSKPS